MLTEAAPALQSYGRERLKADLSASPLCARKGSSQTARDDFSHERGQVVTEVSLFTEDTLSAATYTALADIESEAAAASNPTDLAGRLSPILDSAPSLGRDSVVIQTVIGITQGSYEEWYGGTALLAVADPMEDDLRLCEQGQYEDQTYVLEDMTYVCHNGEWLMARYHGPTHPQLRITLVSADAFACQLDWSAVFWSDLGATMAAVVVGAASGTIFTPPWAAGAAVSTGFASSAGAIYQAGKYLRCKLGLS